MLGMDQRCSDFVDRTIAVMEVAYEAGITLFDLADVYGRGRSEIALGELIKKRPEIRSRITIQTKCGLIWPDGWMPGDVEEEGTFTRVDLSHQHIVSAAEGSLQRLGTDCIDILVLHAPHPLMQPEEIAKAFDDLHSTGKVRYFGVSGYDVFQTELLRRHCRQQLVVNLMWLGLARSSPIADRFGLGALVDYCQLKDMQVQAFSPLKGGSIYKKPILLYPAREAGSPVSSAANTLNQVARKYGISPAATMIAWLLRHPARILPIVGATKPEHLLDNCSADSVDLDADDWTALWIASASLNRKIDDEFS
jgi:predicted oxidoreductase